MNRTDVFIGVLFGCVGGLVANLVYYKLKQASEKRMNELNDWFNKR